MERFDAVIIGGGMAGLSAAYHLVNAGLSACVLEREPLLGMHSTGRNAAIFRHLEPAAPLIRLADESRVLIDQLMSADADPDALPEPWLRPVGAAYVARERPALGRLLDAAAEAGLAVDLLEGAALLDRVPQLAGSDVRAAAFCPSDGVIDIAAVTHALARAARRSKVAVRTGAEVASVLVENGRVLGVTLANGIGVDARHVVIAGGAWAAELGARAGAPLPLVPLRRHLALLRTEAALVSRDLPVVWRVDDDEVYARAEAGELLVSPCDEAPWPPSIPPTDAAALDVIADKLPRFLPRAAEAEVRTAWACLRTFAPDRGLVVGADPRVAGLHWLAGLGGHGMTLGLAAGAVLSRGVLGRANDDDGLFSPSRLLA